jgi:predicted transcriptional regulator
MGKTTSSIADTKPKIIKKLGTKKPKTAREIALALGFSSHHKITHALAALVEAGEIQKTKGGYIKAA